MTIPTLTRWTDAETETLIRMAEAQHSSDQIAAAVGRSIHSVRTKRRELVASYVPHKHLQSTGPAAAATRIKALEETIEGAMAERRPDWELIDQLIGGLLWLRARR